MGTIMFLKKMDGWDSNHGSLVTGQGDLAAYPLHGLKPWSFYLAIVLKRLKGSKFQS